MIYKYKWAYSKYFFILDFTRYYRIEIYRHGKTKIFRIKVNLPVGATLSNITYKIGSDVDIIKSFGNVKYNPNYNVYLANKSANSGNDLYFTDLQTIISAKRSANLGKLIRFHK